MKTATTLVAPLVGVVLLVGCERQETPSSVPAEPPVAATPTAPSAPPSEATPPPKPEPAPPPDPSVEAEALVTTVESLGALHTEHAEDCPGLAEAIGAFHSEHGASLADAPAPVLAHVDATEDLRLRMRAAMEPVMSASMRCREHPAFVAALDELFGDGADGAAP